MYETSFENIELEETHNQRIGTIDCSRFVKNLRESRIHEGRRAKINELIQSIKSSYFNFKISAESAFHRKNVESFVD